MPQSFSPLRHVSAMLTRVLLDGLPLARRVVGVDPRLEINGLHLRKLQQQVDHVALGVDQNGGDFVQRGLFEQANAEPRLAAARHADADGVGGEVARVVVDGLVAALAGGEIVARAEVEGAESFGGCVAWEA